MEVRKQLSVLSFLCGLGTWTQVVRLIQQAHLPAQTAPLCPTNTQTLTTKMGKIEDVKASV